MSSVIIDQLVLDNSAAALNSLTAMSSQQGYRFIQRLQSEWVAGVNRFSQPGEALLGATVNGKLVGVCGVNQDPYTADSSVARLRHLYVDPDHRKKRIGFMLADACIKTAQLHFYKIRLRMARQDTEEFYRALGFVPIDCADASHEMCFQPAVMAVAKDPEI